MDEALIFDTDPGTDDALALLFLAAFKAPIAAMISTYGNLPLNITDSNLKKLAFSLNIGAPIITGADRPLEGNADTAEEFHGKNGLGGAQFASGKVNTYSGSLSEFLQRRGGRADIIAVGPLTNAAKLISESGVGQIRSLTVMGGGFRIFNCPRRTEFNFHCDPAAVRTVLNSGADITLIPLDLTHKTAVSEETIESALGGVSGISEQFYTLMRFSLRSNAKYKTGGAVIHDAVAVLAYLYPDCFRFAERNVVCNKYGALEFAENGVKIRVAESAQDGFVQQKFAEAAKFLQNFKKV